MSQSRLPVRAKIDTMQRNGRARATVLARAFHNGLRALAGDKVLIANTLLLGFSEGDEVYCSVKENSQQRRETDEKWFALKMRPVKEVKSSIEWSDWQVGFPLPNTVHGSNHAPGPTPWGLACWKCGSAKVDGTQVHQIKNSAVWTNIAQLAGTFVEPKEVDNRYKKCLVQNVRCCKCKSSLGTLYKKPYFDSDTQRLTVTKVFPCVKLTTAWEEKESGLPRFAMVVTGPSKEAVEQTLQRVPCSQEPLRGNNRRIDSYTQQLLSQVDAHAQLAARREAETQLAKQEKQQAELKFETIQAECKDQFERRTCCICDDVVALSLGLECGGPLDPKLQHISRDVNGGGGAGGEEPPSDGNAPPPQEVQSGAHFHFICQSCLEQYVCRKLQEPLDALAGEDGQIFCPGRVMSHPSSQCYATPLPRKSILKFCTESTFEAYLDKIVEMRGEPRMKEFEKSFDERVKREAKLIATLSEEEKEARCWCTCHCCHHLRECGPIQTIDRVVAGV
eukprot:INCI12127.1.p1 GENE.INCI12127.1~~INCI12127.1.p1  ORF type:complete len:505 (-),score=76.75 INCI12127.1:1146-2660(-)